MGAAWGAEFMHAQRAPLALPPAADVAGGGAAWATEFSGQRQARPGGLRACALSGGGLS